jgi:hypothetical protein
MPSLTHHAALPAEYPVIPLRTTRPCAKLDIASERSAQQRNSVAQRHAAASPHDAVEGPPRLTILAIKGGGGPDATMCLHHLKIHQP